MNLGPQMANISMNNRKGILTLDHMGSPLKNQHFEHLSWTHVTKDQNIGLVANFHKPRPSNGWKFSIFVQKFQMKMKLFYGFFGVNSFISSIFFSAHFQPRQTKNVIEVLTFFSFPVFGDCHIAAKLRSFIFRRIKECTGVRRHDAGRLQCISRLWWMMEFLNRSKVYPYYQCCSNWNPFLPQPRLVAPASLIYILIKHESCLYWTGPWW